jgi:hypothetical protein
MTQRKQRLALTRVIPLLESKLYSWPRPMPHRLVECRNPFGPPEGWKLVGVNQGIYGKKQR